MVTNYPKAGSAAITRTDIWSFRIATLTTVTRGASSRPNASGRRAKTIRKARVFITSRIRSVTSTEPGDDRMSLNSVLLVLLSACLHVVMHVTLKGARDRASFLWWTWLWASLIFLPVPILFWQSGSALAWAILIVSAVFESLYYVAISKAYKSGDLSVVYP